MKISFLPLAGLALVVSASIAHATSFNFDYSFDGSSISQTVASETAEGSSLSVGDDFTVRLSTANNDYFDVTNSFQQYLPMTYLLTQGAVRTGNIVSKFYLNGNLVEQINEYNASQQNFHVGAQNWHLNLGLQFDEVVMTYDFLSVSNSSPTVIKGADDFFYAFGSNNLPFFNSPDISYVAAVPLPAAMPLLAFAIAGLGWAGRRRRRH